MKMLVTGGTGFTGAALVLRLCEEGHKVRSLDMQSGVLDKELKAAGAELVHGSVADRDAVRKTMNGVDIVFHLAAAFRKINVPESHYVDVNVNGTTHVMEEARDAGVTKVVYCSTQGVHGHVEDPPGDETSPIAPADYYQQTKYEGEMVVREFAKTGMKTTIIRPTAIFGPGDPGRFLMIYKRVHRGRFPIFGTGDVFYHPVYIDNLVDGFLLSMNPEKGNGQEYLIADSEYVTIENLVKRVGRSMGVDVKTPHYPITPLIAAGHICEKICRPLGIVPPIFPRRVDWFRQVRAFRIDKARRDLGYEPRVSLDRGLLLTFEWYRERGYL